MRRIPGNADRFVNPWTLLSYLLPMCVCVCVVSVVVVVLRKSYPLCIIACSVKTLVFTCCYTRDCTTEGADASNGCLRYSHAAACVAVLLFGWMTHWHWLGTQMPTSTAPGGGVTITPQLGISYYFDSVGNNCASGELKISVYVYHCTNQVHTRSEHS